MPTTKKITKIKPKTKVKKKEKISKVEKKDKNEKKVKGTIEYFEAIGRRKTAVARIRIWTKGKVELLVNGKPYKDYFTTAELQQVSSSSLEKMKCLDKFRVQIIVKGGGIRGQAEAIRHGTARALVLFNPDFKKRLRKAGYLTRDPRMRERKKFGLKRARRAPQWQKR